MQLFGQDRKLTNLLIVEMHVAACIWSATSELCKPIGRSLKCKTLGNEVSKVRCIGFGCEK